jgi:hypothetical protein
LRIFALGFASRLNDDARRYRDFDRSSRRRVSVSAGVALAGKSSRRRLRGVLELPIIFYGDVDNNLANCASREGAKARRSRGVIALR